VWDLREFASLHSFYSTSGEIILLLIVNSTRAVTIRGTAPYLFNRWSFKGESHKFCCEFFFISLYCKVIQHCRFQSSSLQTSGELKKKMGSKTVLDFFHFSIVTLIALLSCSFATIEENGYLAVWVASEINNEAFVSESDLGLAIGGKLKLFRISSSRVGDSVTALLLPESRTGMKSYCGAINPLDSNHCFVGTDVGIIIGGSRFTSGTSAGSVYLHPSSRKGEKRDLLNNCAVQSIEFSSFFQEYFLAAFDDGSLGIYFTLDSQKPIVEWELGLSRGEKVIRALWAQTRPGVFFCLTSSRLFLFDLLESTLPNVETLDISRSSPSYCAIR
jgi:hypothetical protein